MHLVGHSYGAIVAVLAAARRVENVKSLALIEPPATRVAAGDPAVDAWATDLRALFAEPGDNLNVLLRRFFSLAGVPAAVPDPLPEPLARGARALVGARSPTEAHLPLGAIAEAGVSCLVISGDHHKAYEAVCDRIAVRTNAERAIIPGAGHLVPDTGRPFNTRLEAFWLRCST